MNVLLSMPAEVVELLDQIAAERAEPGLPINRSEAVRFLVRDFWRKRGRKKNPKKSSVPA